MYLFVFVGSLGIVKVRVFLYFIIIGFVKVYVLNKLFKWNLINFGFCVFFEGNIVNC